MYCLSLELAERQYRLFCEFFYVPFHIGAKINLFILQGFTHNGQPVLNKFLKVKGTFGTSISAKVYSPPTVLIHIRLQSIAHIAHFTIVDQLLSEYYSEDNPLTVFDLPYSIGHDQAATDWNSKVTKLVARLSSRRHVIIFITTHSVPENGDLWLGKDRKGDDIATTVGNVSDICFIVSY